MLFFRFHVTHVCWNTCKKKKGEEEQEEVFLWHMCFSCPMSKIFDAHYVCNFAIYSQCKRIKSKWHLYNFVHKIECKKKEMKCTPFYIVAATFYTEYSVFSFNIYLFVICGWVPNVRHPNLPVISYQCKIIIIVVSAAKWSLIRNRKTADFRKRIN